MDENSKMTFARLESQLQAEEARHSSTEQALALSQQQQRQLNQRPFVQSKKKTNSRNSTSTRSKSSPTPRNNSVVVCSNCGRRGHPVERCRIKEAEQQLRRLSLTQINEVLKTLENLQTPPHQQSLQAQHSPSESDHSDDEPSGDIPPQEVHLTAMMAALDDKWVLDSGATSHYSKRRDNLKGFSPATSSNHVTTAGGSQLPVVGSGHLNVGRNKDISQVLYVPDIQSNLLSVGSFTDKGHWVLFNSKHCFVLDNRDIRKIFLKGDRDPHNRLYTLRLPGSSTRTLRIRRIPKPRLSEACTVFDDPGPHNATE